MALTEKSIYDKIEIVGDEGWTLQWRKNNQVLKDGVVIASSYERGLCEPVWSSYDLEKKEWVFTEHDMSKAPFTNSKIKTIATALWTDDAKTAYKKWVEENRTPS
jgi:hypothetical protein